MLRFTAWPENRKRQKGPSALLLGARLKNGMSVTYSLEFGRFLVTVLGDEVLVHPDVRLSADLIT